MILEQLDPFSPNGSGETMHAMITGIGHCVPEAKLTNQDLEKLVDTNDKWIRARTGIEERRILDKDKATSDMAVEAARNVLAQRNISPDDIDLIVVATFTPDMLIPSTAAFVQKKLNARNCWGYDLNAGCSGFICALVSGAQFIESGRHQKVLVIGADKMSAIMDYQDRDTCILFGDGAGAVLLEPCPNNGDGIIDFSMHLDGTGDKFLCMTGGGSRYPASHETVDKRMHFLYQEGKTVFKHAIRGISEDSAALLEKNRLKSNDVDLFIPHQANIRIMDAIADKLKLDPDKMVVNIEKYGNTSAATIPLAMSEAYQQGRMHPGDLILLSAFGAGFAWGSILFKWAIN